ncbi:isoleucine--tRNA ligase [Patescibacteria group bacterium]|nr:isoleucine--tRNA ligase [Patescibacteria group bacterium]
MLKKIENFQQQLDLPKIEEEIVSYWDEVDAFDKSIRQRSENKRFIFYDGPPFATGTPHYGHLLASTIKDVVPRYWAMKGYRVERVWGWDCHGLPIENIIEKELDLQGGKTGIEKMGIGKFNAACRSTILHFDKDWEKLIKRIGRWVNFKKSYKTMDNSYMESVWWAFKQLFEKGLVYEGRKVVLYCPRCATPLSNFEIAMDNSYKNIEDNSLFVSFKRKGSSKEYFIAWTTTPWTLIGNVALVVDKKTTYVKVAWQNNEYWVAKKLAESIFKQKLTDLVILDKKKGMELIGYEYEPLYNYMPLDGKKAHYIASSDFVSIKEGTGIVHIAAIFGEDDYRLAQELNLPCIPTLDEQGRFLSFVTPIDGVFYKKAEQWILDDLLLRGLNFRSEKVVHSYPFCYRCNTPLYFNAISAWFINVQKLKPELIKQNKEIKWYPDYLKYGRFGKGLKSAPDWNVSRSRYWGTPMPIWINRKYGKIRVIGSFNELKKWAISPDNAKNIKDYHREFLDPLEIWVDDEKTIRGRRIPEVFDCWVESGSMPFASIHYPFENKEKFEKSYPAQFISEYIAQTRAWFYALHVFSVGLFGKPSFQNAVATGTILAEDGSKMSKSKKNYPDPMILINKHGVDPLRLYLMSSTLMKAEDLNFHEKSIIEIKNSVLSKLWNTFAFYKLYATQKHDYSLPKSDKIEDVMDRWIASKIEKLTKEVTKSMDKYNLVSASHLIMDFIDILSTRYLRESRDRLKDEKGNDQASRVFGAVLKRLIILACPIIPFLTEAIYQNLLFAPKESIHLENWPSYNEGYIDDKLENEITLIYQVAEKAHSIRKEKGIKVRQPLAKLHVEAKNVPSDEVLEILRQEINVEKIEWFVNSKSDLTVNLDLIITEELRQKGLLRESIRLIQSLRKLANVKIDEHVNVQLPSWPEKYEEEIKTKTLVSRIVQGNEPKIIAIIQ